MDTGINDRAAAADPYRTSDLAVHWLALEELAAPHQAQARTAVLRALAEEVDDVPGAEQATEALLWHLQSPKGLAVLAETAPDVLAAARQRLDDEALREAMQDDLAQAEVALGDAPPGAYQEVAAVKALEARFEPRGRGCASAWRRPARPWWRPPGPPPRARRCQRPCSALPPPPAPCRSASG